MVTNNFKLPIEYCSNKQLVTKNIHDDLECNKVKNIYDLVFDSNNQLGRKISLEWNKNYTTNKKFLKESQYLYQHVKLNKVDDTILNYNDEFNKFIALDKSIFLEKYQYIDFSYIEFLNNYSKIMQVLSVNNLLSPVLTILLPIIILFIPFLLIRLQNKQLTFSTYFALLKQCFKRLPIGKVLSQAGDGKLRFDKQLSIVGSVVFYVLQIYGNFMSCRRFYKNLFFINTFLHKTSIFIKHTITNIDKLLFTSNNLVSYNTFNNSLSNNKKILLELYNNISHIKHFKITFNNLTSIGYSMKYFYKLFVDNTLKTSLKFFLDFNGYVDNINGLQNNIKLGKLQYCKFTNKESEFKESFYIVLPFNKCTKNNYKLNKNMLITGPNAAGKTTLLKSTLLNILLSQQLGCGCYKSAKINPYDYLHCYLNIPDTSQRDSLFQSEARRCKDILSLIEKNKDKRHFCIFDELYSGTNPYEAISTSHAYLTYLSENKNIKFMITTHYIKLCEALKSNKKTVNKHMEILEKNEVFTYTYKLKHNISKIKGGIKVLNDLNYPEDIVKHTKDFLHNNF